MGSVDVAEVTLCLLIVGLGSRTQVSRDDKRPWDCLCPTVVAKLREQLVETWKLVV